MEGERKDLIEIRPWETEWRYTWTDEQQRVALDVHDDLRWGQPRFVEETVGTTEKKRGNALDYLFKSGESDNG